MKSDVVEQLFIKYYNDALLYTLTLSKSKAVAEDIVGAAFYKALETADDSVTSFKYWLLRTCRNLYYNHHRVSKRHSELSDNLPDERESVLDKIIKSDEYLALYHAIDMLPALHKEVITLFYFEDMKLESISKIIDKSLANVKVILFRARQELKEILEV